jgi:tight adherence protein B
VEYGMKILLLSLLGGIICTAFCLLVFACMVSRGSVVVSRRLGLIAGTAADEEEKEKIGFRKRVRLVIRKLAGKLERFNKGRRLDRKMQQAGLPILGTEYLVMAGGASLLAGVFLSLLASSLAIGAAGVSAGVLAAYLYLDMKIAHRLKQFTNQLGDTLAMVANALISGFSFLQAMDLVSREMPAPMGEEFQRALQDIRLGMTQEKALQRMSERVGSADFDLVVTSVMIQRQVGGNLARILKTIANTIDDRIRMKREVMTLTAQGRMSGWILAAVPFVIGAYLTALHHNYFDPLLQHPLGPFIIGGTILSILTGLFFINRIVNFKI